MESYIVRIYRRDERDPHLITGLVEAVQTGEVNKFSGYDELFSRLKKASIEKHQARLREQAGPPPGLLGRNRRKD